MKIFTSKQIWSGLLLAGILLSVADFSNAQISPGESERTIQGMVKDSENNTLPGVSILVKGTQQGTMTDQNGAFKISVPDDNAELVFSFVGYVPQTLAVGSNSTLNITLQSDLTTLDEVVVIGYGTQTRRNVTGSVAKIDMKNSENLPNINVTQALRGQVAGVQFIDNGRPGQNGSILVRGPNSLSASTTPLIVVDGIFFNGSLAEINPNDIESIEVLKDASAASIYGSRAANGVILITSKKGTSEKPTISFNAFAGLYDRAHHAKMMGPERYIQRILDNREQRGLEADPAKILSYLHPSEAANYEAGKIVDPWELVSQQGKISSYDLSVSGKTDRSNYYLSGSLVDEKGLFYNDNMKRTTLRANFETKITDWLTTGMTTTYSARDYSGLEPEATTNVGPFSTPFFEDGEPTFYLLPEDQVSQKNPLRRALLTVNEEKWNNIFANFYARIDVPFIKGLSYRINYSPNLRWRHEYDFFKQDKHLAGNTTFAEKYNRQDFDWVMEHILSYSHEFNENHALDATLLYGRNHFGWESTSAYAEQLSFDALGWNNLSLGSLFTNSSNAQESDGLSSMFRVNYRLMNRYLFTLTARRDGSSVFAENHKYATFPSAAFAWIITDESFAKSLNVIDMLKLRLSYGAVGNQAISPYQSLSRAATRRYVFGDGGASSLGVYSSAMSNSDLKWETTYSTNIAVDFELFRGRLAGTLEYYNMNTEDLLVERSLPVMTGFTDVWTNLGAVNNRGYEVTLNSVNLRKGDFQWSTSFVFSKNKNKIVHLYNSDTDGDGREDDDLGNRWFIGESMNVAYDFVFDGIYQEEDTDIPNGLEPGYIRFKDLNGDGVINAAGDRRVIGLTEQPKYKIGFGNTFTYRNLSLSVFVNSMRGWIGDLAYPFDANTDYHYNKPDVEWWTAENRSNKAPKTTYDDPYGHDYWASRDFVRIQDVSLVYNFGDKLIGKTPISSLRLFVSGKNLATFTEWMGADPETGGNFNSIPVPRSVTIGLNLQL